MPTIGLSIIAPAHDERGNVPGLVEDVRAAMHRSDIAFELILVDDASTDGTRRAIAAEAARYPWVHGLALDPRSDGRGHGQSAAFRAGVLAAQGELVALLDADRQNDPGDLPEMIKLLEKRHADMVQGDRSANRRDSWVRRFASWVGRTFRRLMLGDNIRDTGCSLRVLRREIAVALPLQYRGMHRFIPFYARMLGCEVVEMPVKHRPRTVGSTKYGTFERALPGLRDLFAVRWMRSRLREASADVIEPAYDDSELRDPRRVAR